MNAAMLPLARRAPARAEAIYIVTIIDRHHRRHRYTAIANSWFEAWRSAVNEHGIAALVMVKPWRPVA